MTDARGEIAIVQAEEGIMLPGGGLDASESAAGAAVREVAEECGLEVAITGDLGDATEFVRSSKKGATFEKRSRFVSATVQSTKSGATPEHPTQWLSVRAALDAVTCESHAWAIRRWQRLNS